MAIRNKAFSKVTALSNKVAEVELSKEGVDLASVKDLDKKLNQLFGVQRKLDKKLPALKKLEEEVGTEQRNLAILIKESEKALAEFDKQAKELGISASTVSSYKTLDIETSNSKEYIK